jgi:HEAT repeat protein
MIRQVRSLQSATPSASMSGDSAHEFSRDRLPRPLLNCSFASWTSLCMPGACRIFSFLLMLVLLLSASKFSALQSTVVELLAQLDDKKPDAVQLATYRLAQYGDALADNEQAKTRLGKLLRDPKQPDPVREVAAYALGRVGPGAASQIPDLELALSDRSARVKRAAAEALGRIGANRDDVLEYLNNAFDTSDLSVRVACIAGFASIGPRHSMVVRLSTMLDQENAPELKRAAAFALAQMTPDATSAIPFLLRALRSSDSDLRQVSAWVLGLIGPAASPATPQLVRLLTDKKDAIRRVAADALGRIGSDDDNVVSAMIDRLLHDPNLDVKTAAANTLGRIGYKRGVASALFQAVHAEDDPALMLAAATALSKINPPPDSDVNALVKMAAKCPYSDVREVAIRAIGHIHQQPKVGVPALVNALKDPVPSVAITAAEALGEYGTSASSSLSALRAASTIPGTRLASSRAIQRIASALRDRFETYPDSNDYSLRHELADDRTELERAKQQDPDHVDADSIIVLSQAISALDRNILGSEINKWFTEHKSVTRAVVATILYLIWIGILYLGVLRFSPITLIGWNEALSGMGGIKFPDTIGGLTITPRDFVLLNSFRSQRVLEAWIDEYADHAWDNFADQGIRKNRNVFCSLPVDVDGELIAELSPEKLRPCCGLDRWLLRIVGEGGLGKTTLACQIALWAIDKEASKRLIPNRRMIPIVLERGTGMEALHDWAQFMKAIRGQLRDLIGEAKEVPEWLCAALLRDRRILVIVDGLSEMEFGAARPLPLYPEFSAAALIVTSRSESLWADVNHTDIRPHRIDRDHLIPFMNAYLGKASQTLRDDEIWEACKRLSGLVGKERSITPLLARLYAEQLANTNAFKKKVLRNIPELILGYITTLKGERKPGDPDPSALHRAAELTAWWCCKDNCNAGYARRDDVLRALLDPGRGLTPELLDLLERRLQLVRTIAPSETHIEFAMDTVAEYLAGLWLVHELSNDQAWFEFLDKADASLSSRESVCGFLAAVLDCCTHERQHFKGSASVLSRLEHFVGIKQPEEIPADVLTSPTQSGRKPSIPSGLPQLKVS